MPDKRPLQFASSYEAQAKNKGVDIDSRIDDSLRSFMDKGDEVFAGEIVDTATGKTREQVVEGVRGNILNRMRQVNTDSRQSADRQRGEHRRYSELLVRDMTRISGTVRSRKRNADEYLELVDRERAEGTGRIARFFISARKNARIRAARNINARLDSQHAEMMAKAERWQDREDEYLDKVYRRHYAEYDALAKTWYELTRGYARIPQAEALEGEAPEGGIQPEVPDQRAIPDDAAKSIVEYTGIYDARGLENLLGTVSRDPDTAVSADSFAITDYKSLEGKADADPANHTKTHKRILMLTREDEDTKIRTRMKFTSNLKGRMSKKQFTAADSNVATAIPGPIPKADFSILAEEADLESDERDINGGYLYSEKNAEILSARLKRNGETVYGFYMNGEFLTDEDAADAPGGRVSGKEGMKWSGRRNWDKQEKAEKLRVAIRKSPFFQHVNARTIQFYTSYQADVEYTKKISQIVGDRMVETIVKSGMGINSVVEKLQADPAGIEEVPDGLKAPAVIYYINEKIRAGEAVPFDKAMDEPVIKYAIENYGKEMISASMQLLTENDPRLWTLARSMVENNSSAAIRTMDKLKYLPQGGEAMRMALMNELLNHQKAGSEFNIMNPLGILNTPGKRVLTEELNSRRGVGNWFKRNLLNGNLMRQVFTAAELGVQMSDNISDINFAIDTGEEMKDLDIQADRAQKTAWFAYAEMTSDYTNMSNLLSMAGVGITALATDSAGGNVAGNAAVGRTLTFDVFSLAGMIAPAADMIKGVGELVKYVWKRFSRWYKRKKGTMTDEQYEAEIAAETKVAAGTLQDLDGGTLKKIIKFCSSAIRFTSSGRSILANHITAQGGTLVYQNDDIGNFLRARNPFDLILTNLQRIVKIVDDIRDIVASSRRIGRIDQADASIETAIRAMVPLSENDERMGEAAKKNSQAQYFMSLSRMQARKSRSASAWNIGSNVAGGLRDLSDLIGNPVFKYIARTVTSILPKTIEFISWTIGKLKYDRQNFNNNIAMMLGDKSYADTPYFDKVLKRETGIVNKHYLVDLARIFTAIDTHAMVKNPNASAGEMELAKKVVGTLYGNVNNESVRTIRLGAMLGYAGMSPTTDWRSLLRNSIMA